MLNTLGPDFGYLSSDKKWWIIAKPDKKESVKEVFQKTDIRITMKGEASKSGDKLTRVSRRICQWEGANLISDVVQLAEFSHFLRTLPEYQDLLESRENAISLILISPITGRKGNQQDKDIPTLLACLRGACALQIQDGKQVGSSLIRSKWQRYSPTI